jgi:4-hydroxy-3-methylbut-2-enyl diphosphate reductase
MKVETAKTSGYCFGVKRALEIAENALDEYAKKGREVYSIGQIIHNSGVTENLKTRGLIAAENEGEIKPGSVFIVRSHGMPAGILKKIEQKKVKIIDATCPFVKNAQVKAAELVRTGCYLVVIGDKRHPEVRSIIDGIPEERISVIENVSETGDIKKSQKIGVVMQTTQIKANVQSIISGLMDRAKTLIIENTICNTTEKRQDEARRFARSMDAVIVVGSRNSANTTHLADISREYNEDTFHVENYTEIEPGWLTGKKKIGVTGGASTPQGDITDVKNFLENL